MHTTIDERKYLKKLNSQTADDNVTGANVKCAPVVQSAGVQFLDNFFTLSNVTWINSNSMFYFFVSVELRRLLLSGVCLPGHRGTISDSDWLK